MSGDARPVGATTVGASADAAAAGGSGPGGSRWPVEIRVLRAERRLEIDWDDGATFSYPAELLRVESPSAEVQGHSAAQRTIPPGKRLVGITELQPVGNYAVRVVFDDGHSTGIYAWPWLRRLGVEQETIWAAYLTGLEAKGLSRDQ